MKFKRPNDYMKYWRIVRKLVKEKYGVGTEQLDFLFFLYSEEYFSLEKFTEYQKLFQWDSARFHGMIKDGWIENYKPKLNTRKAIYGLTYKATRMVGWVYDILNGGLMPEHKDNNPFFKKTKIPYTFKLYRDATVRRNDAIRQQQRQSLE